MLNLNLGLTMGRYIKGSSGLRHCTVCTVPYRQVYGSPLQVGVLRFFQGLNIFYILYIIREHFCKINSSHFVLNCLNWVCQIKAEFFFTLIKFLFALLPLLKQTFFIPGLFCLHFLSLALTLYSFEALISKNNSVKCRFLWPAFEFQRVG